jgi:hypothetical protein
MGREKSALVSKKTKTPKKNERKTKPVVNKEKGAKGGRTADVQPKRKQPERKTIKVTLDKLKNDIDELIKNTPKEWLEAYFKGKRDFSDNVPNIFNLGNKKRVITFSLYHDMLDKAFSKIEKAGVDYRAIVEGRQEELNSANVYEYVKVCEHDRNSLNNLIADSKTNDEFYVAVETESGQNIEYRIIKKDNNKIRVNGSSNEDDCDFRKGDDLLAKIEEVDSPDGSRKISLNKVKIKSISKVIPDNLVKFKDEDIDSTPFELLFAIKDGFIDDIEIDTESIGKNEKRDGEKARLELEIKTYKENLEEFIRQAPKEWLEFYVKKGKALTETIKTKDGIRLNFEAYKSVLDEFIPLIEKAEKGYRSELLKKIIDFEKYDIYTYKDYEKSQSGLAKYISKILQEDVVKGRSESEIIDITGTTAEGRTIVYSIRRNGSKVTINSFPKDAKKTTADKDYKSEEVDLKDVTDIFKIKIFEQLKSVSKVIITRQGINDVQRIENNKIKNLYLKLSERLFAHDRFKKDKGTVEYNNFNKIFNRVVNEYTIQKDKPIQIDTGVKKIMPEPERLTPPEVKVAKSSISTEVKEKKTISTVAKQIGKKIPSRKIKKKKGVEGNKEILVAKEILKKDSKKSGGVIYEKEVLKVAIAVKTKYKPYIGAKVKKDDDKSISIRSFVDGSKAKEWAVKYGILEGTKIVFKEKVDFKKIRIGSLTLEDIDIEKSNLVFGKDTVRGDKEKILKDFTGIQPLYYRDHKPISDPSEIRKALLRDVRKSTLAELSRINEEFIENDRSTGVGHRFLRR